MLIHERTAKCYELFWHRKNCRTGVTYGLFHNDVNSTAAGGFQILTDWYYNAPLGPNFADMPENP
jgi:hypothetical protein